MGKLSEAPEKRAKHSNKRQCHLACVYDTRLGQVGLSIWNFVFTLEIPTLRVYFMK